MPVEERKQLFHTELVKAGVDFYQAEKVATLLAKDLLDEQLTHEEKQLVQEVCTQWLAQRKRMNFISQILTEAPKKASHHSSSSLIR